ncbi:14127_t:CDS:2 [Entrophospora sp. SA101]|nr:14127_t:CDS:2 [Entrophospora sp. SA101]
MFKFLHLQKIKAERQNGGLKPYWSEIIREKEKIAVKELHLTGSLKLLGTSIRRNVQELIKKSFRECMSARTYKSDNEELHIISFKGKAVNHTLLYDDYGDNYEITLSADRLIIDFPEEILMKILEYYFEI